LLYVIDQRPFRAQLAQAKASLAQAEANLVNARQNLGRNIRLIAQKAVSQQDYDTAVAQERSSAALVEAQRAVLRNAELNLEFATLRASRDGFMSSSLVKPGALIPAQQTLLTTLYSSDPMWVNFSVSENRLLVPELEREIARQESFISVLLGQNPRAIARGRDIDAMQFPAVPEGLPASLLARRPDIRQAEQQLIAANAPIDGAMAAYFPDISLTALLGLESAELSNLFIGPSRIWSFGTAVAQPIFNAGRIRSQVAQAEALQAQAQHTYEKSIVSAFQEVENL